MTIDWKATIKTWDGKMFKESKDPDAKDATLAFVACQAIDAGLMEDQGVSGAAKEDREELMEKVLAADKDTVFTKTDIEFIKERIAKAYPSPWIVGKCRKLLSGTNGEMPKEAQ